MLKEGEEPPLSREGTLYPLALRGQALVVARPSGSEAEEGECHD